MTDRPSLPPPLQPRPTLSRRVLGILQGRTTARDMHEVLQAHADLLGHPDHALVPDAARERAERLRRHYWITLR